MNNLKRNLTLENCLFGKMETLLQFKSALRAQFLYYFILSKNFPPFSINNFFVNFLQYQRYTEKKHTKHVLNTKMVLVSILRKFSQGIKTFQFTLFCVYFIFPAIFLNLWVIFSIPKLFARQNFLNSIAK